jgi:hypothetical protein
MSATARWRPNCRDPRVTLLEGLNARDLRPGHVPEPPGIITADVSFISLKLALPPALALAPPGAWLVALIKPQFEAGPAHLSKGGVVRDAKCTRRCAATSPVAGNRHELAGDRHDPSPVPAAAATANSSSPPASLDNAPRNDILTSMLTPIDKLLYTARQSARVAWYMGHYFASRRYHRRRQQDRKEAPKRRRSRARPGPAATASCPTWRAVRARSRQRRGRPLSRCRATTTGLRRDPGGEPALFRRPADHGGAQGRRALPRGPVARSCAAKLPDYFLQNFHYQTDGYLTEHSAKLYDTQVEVLFSGSANAMRRQCLVPLSDYMRAATSARAPARRRLRHRALPALRQAGLAAHAAPPASICRTPIWPRPASPEALSRRRAAYGQRRGHAVRRRQSSTS